MPLGVDYSRFSDGQARGVQRVLFCDPERALPCPSLPQPLSPHLGASTAGNGRLGSAGWAAHPGHSPETVERGGGVSDRSHQLPSAQDSPLGLCWPPPSPFTIHHKSTLQTLAEHWGCKGHSVCHANGSWAAGGGGKGVRHCPCLAACPPPSLWWAGGHHLS